ncbi:MAG: MMPL family transporter [Sinobacterium sp.]|nr:MMPL family transporter [Sinobacterium sp.]
MFPALSKWLCLHPKLSLFLAALCIVLFVFAGHKVRLNNHFSVLFAVDNESNSYREFYREAFGADDGILMGVIKLDSITPEAVAHIKDITETLEKHSEFERVWSVTNASVIRSVGDSLLIDPVFDDLSFDHKQGSDEMSPQEAFNQKITWLRESPITAGRLISADHEILIILAQMPNDLDRFKRIREPAEFFQKTIESAFSDTAIQGELIQGSQRTELHFAGIAFTRIAILKLMFSDLFFLLPLSAGVLGLLTFLLYRSIAMVFISFGATLFGIAATLAVIGINGDDINQLTVTFPCLLMAIVVANSIHFFHRYYLEIEKGLPPAKAVEVMAEQVSKATFLSCFTTAIGFFALLTADMSVLRSFGLYLGSGILLSFFGLILIIPPALMLIQPTIRYRPNPISDSPRFDRFIDFLIHKNRRLKVFFAAVTLLLVSSYIASLATYDYFLKDMLDDSHPQIVAGDLLDKEVSGGLPLEISLLGIEGDFEKSDNLHKLYQLNTWLIDENIDKHALSLATVLQSLNAAFSGSEQFPESDAVTAQLMLLALGSEDAIVEQLLSDDASHTRIRANITDIGAVKVMQLKQRIESHGNQLFSDTGIRVTVTGELPVAYEGMNKLTQELINSVLTALVFIVITIVFIFRDWRLAIASLFPNILPIVMGMALYSLSGAGLNPLPGIAFCIAIGIAVDDTVHLFARFNEELTLGKTREQAIADAVKAVKGALFSSSFILTIGFLLFLLSGFTWNRDLGILGAFLIVIALVSDLLFTPAILAIGSKEKE